MNNAPAIILDAQNPCSPLSVPAGRTALLLLDFHAFIIASQPSSGKGVVSSASKLRKWARDQGILIIHCLIDLGASTPLNRKMAARVNGVRDKMRDAPVEAKGEPEEIAAVAGEYVVTRPPSHVSAMGSYGIDALLKEHGIESLLLAGFSTSGCVINTAKGAADQGRVVTLLRDACGDKDQEVHEVIMDKLLVGQAHVTSVREFITAWDGTDL